MGVRATAPTDPKMGHPGALLLRGAATPQGDPKTEALGHTGHVTPVPAERVAPCTHCGLSLPRLPGMGAGGELRGVQGGPGQSQGSSGGHGRRSRGCQRWSWDPSGVQGFWGSPRGVQGVPGGGFKVVQGGPTGVPEGCRGSGQSQGSAGGPRVVQGGPRMGVEGGSQRWSCDPRGVTKVSGGVPDALGQPQGSQGC